MDARDPSRALTGFRAITESEGSSLRGASLPTRSSLNLEGVGSTQLFEAIGGPLKAKHGFESGRLG
jgi:hypothetical protein